MSRLINADTIVHYQTYDDEHEEFSEHESTIADFLDKMTDEGCPNPVDAVTVKHGRWMLGVSLWYCSECGSSYSYNDYAFCPYCGAKMDGKDGDGNG